MERGTRSPEDAEELRGGRVEAAAAPKRRRRSGGALASLLFVVGGMPREPLFVELNDDLRTFHVGLIKSETREKVKRPDREIRTVSIRAHNGTLSGQCTMVKNKVFETSNHSFSHELGSE